MKYAELFPDKYLFKFNYINQEQWSGVHTEFKYIYILNISLKFSLYLIEFCLLEVLNFNNI